MVLYSKKVEHIFSYWAFKWASLSSMSASSDRSDSTSAAVSSTCNRSHGFHGVRKFDYKPFDKPQKATENLTFSWSVLGLQGSPRRLNNFSMQAALLNFLRLHKRLWDLCYTRENLSQFIATESLSFFPVLASLQKEVPQIIISSNMWSRWRSVLKRVQIGCWIIKVIWNNLYPTRTIIHESNFNFNTTVQAYIINTRMRTIEIRL